jgi:acyl-CoA thioester hydrolase
MCDVDALGVVWYGNYLVYCDEARAELLRAFDLAPATFLERGFVAVVVEVESKHLAPARFEDELDVRVRVEPGSGTRLSFLFDISRANDGTKLATVRTDMVLLRPDGELIFLMPDDVRAPVDRMLAAQEEVGA